MVRPTDLADLELPPAELRVLADQTVARVLDHLATLDTQPACGDVHAEDLCRRMREAAPEQPSKLRPLLDAIFDEWVPRSFTTTSPGGVAPDEY